ncbi:AAA family ATPase [Sorangium sp. KYC3313]|uniref:AAA family ATPase n=1 Tax=unclassified Sorangium TaxID=2621164 RepID=UPI003F62B8A5
MIREVVLRGFKRFQDERLPLAPLTMLTGFNSGGKSSVMQSLLLLHHAAAHGFDGVTSASTVALNAPGLSLGDLGAVRNETAREDTFTLGIRSGETNVAWTLGWPQLRSDSLAVPVQQIALNGAARQAEVRGEMPFAPSWLRDDTGASSLLKNLARLRFVPADRLGPSETYPLDDPERHDTPGPRAERTFGNLLWRDLDPLPVPALCHSSDPAQTLRRQTEAWLSELFPGTTLEPRTVAHANLITLGIRTSEELGFHRPQNVGFGVTYVLPLILTLLMASAGDTVLFENPEAHLHPRAQARLARFCAKAAAAGIQVILETHSDHVLNGARVAVHSGQIAPEDVSILFFGGPSAPPGEVFSQIRVDRRGRLDQWPAGFFDETDHLLDRLLEPPGTGAP